jgi:uncharacterized protein involved in response to NO
MTSPPELPLRGRPLPAPSLYPWLARGFRPFFTLAAIFAVLFVPAWVGMVSGAWPAPRWLSPSLWHAHEMVYGLVSAAVAGFLLTAVPSWTSARPLSDARLAMLAALWLQGRIAMLAASALSPMLVAVLDLSFAISLLAVLTPPLLRAEQRRNRIFILALAIFLAGNALFHSDALGLWPGAGAVAARVAVDAALLLVVLVGGRIIPAFTQSALLRAGTPGTLRSHRWLDQASIVLTAAVAAADLLAPGTRVGGALKLSAALTLALRMTGWQPMWSRRDPLLWSLHAGFACAPCGLVLLALPDLRFAVSPMAGLHLLAIGCFGTLILSVMSRVSLGHTGRELRAPRALPLAYAAMLLAAIVRVTGALLPGHSRLSTLVAGALFASSFAIFLVVYLPILSAPRADGREG